MSQTIALPANNAFLATTGRNQFQEWGAAIEASAVAAGVAKTYLPGFNIQPVMSKSFQSPAANTLSPSFMIPVHTLTNDFLLVAVTTVSTTTVTTPSGWTLIRSDTASGGTGLVEQYLFYKYAAGTAGLISSDAGTTVTFTLSNTATASSAAMSIYRGVVLSSPINQQAAASSSTNGTTITSGTVTPGVNNCWIVQIMGWDTATVSASSTPTSYTARVQQAAQTSCVFGTAIYDIIQTTAGASSAQTSTLTNTGGWVAQTIALAPAVSGTGTFANSISTSTLTTGGTLTGSTTNFYRISAINAQGETLPCSEFSQATGASTNTNTITINWTAVANATGYKIYGRGTGSETLLTTIVGGAIATWTDTGALSPSGALNTVDTTADSGQIPWGAAPIPSVASTKYVYSIFQLTDTTQATYPIYIRLDFGDGPTSTTNPQMWVTVGTNTNGVGAITSNNAIAPNSLSTSINCCTTVASTWSGTTGIPANLYVDSDGGSTLIIGGWYTPTGSASQINAGVLCIIERTRNWDGTFNSDAVVLGVGNGATVGNFTVILLATSLQYNQPGTGTFPTDLGSGLTPTGTRGVGSSVYLAPIFPLATPRVSGPIGSVLWGGVNDAGAGSTQTITVYGVSRTFLRTNCLSGGTSALWFRQS